jgi:hypothetical protein
MLDPLLIEGIGPSGTIHTSSVDPSISIVDGSTDIQISFPFHCDSRRRYTFSIKADAPGVGTSSTSSVVVESTSAAYKTPITPIDLSSVQLSNLRSVTSLDFEMSFVSPMAECPLTVFGIANQTTLVDGT